MRPDRQRKRRREPHCRRQWSKRAYGVSNALRDASFQLRASSSGRGLVEGLRCASFRQDLAHPSTAERWAFSSARAHQKPLPSAFDRALRHLSASQLYWRIASALIALATPTRSVSVSIRMSGCLVRRATARFLQSLEPTWNCSLDGLGSRLTWRNVDDVDLR